MLQGRDDPRVPRQEADQIVAAVKDNNVPVWYLTAENEGHGFAKKDNADYLFYARIKFYETYLLDGLFFVTAKRNFAALLSRIGATMN